MVCLLATQTLPEQSRILDTLTTGQLVVPVALCIIGTLLMIFGYKAHRWIVFLNSVALGYWVGHLLGESAQISVFTGPIGAVLMGAAAVPLMKYAVAMCGGLVGAIIGMVLWAYCEQPLDFAWTAGLAGAVVLGMLSFVLFKTTVILFTSVEGAGLLVLGVCALLLRYKPWAEEVNANLTEKPVLLPLLILSAAVVALFWQHQKHGLIGDEGSPAGMKSTNSSGDKKK